MDEERNHLTDKAGDDHYGGVAFEKQRLDIIGKS